MKKFHIIEDGRVFLVRDTELKIVDLKTKKVLYEHELFHLPLFDVNDMSCTLVWIEKSDEDEDGEDVTCSFPKDKKIVKGWQYV